MSSSAAVNNLDDINLILRNSGQKEMKVSDIQGEGTFKLDYSFKANYVGNIPNTLAAVKRLADSSGARAVDKVKMYLLDVLKALDAL